MLPPEHYITPEEVHASHEMRDIGFTISDPECTKCGYGVYYEPEMLRIPCEGKQLDLFGRCR